MTAPVVNGVDVTKQIEDIKATAKASVDDIAASAFSGDLNLQVPPVTLGDTPNPNTPAPNGQPPAPQAIISQLDSLDSEIESAKLEGSNNPQTLASWESLKSRYKNKNKEIRTQVETLSTEKEALAAQLTEANKNAELAKQAQTAIDKAILLENENKALKEEASTNKHFRRKYDLENDPEIKKQYIEPMQGVKKDALDIIQGSGLDESLWADLLAADTEFKLNSVIQSAGLEGIHATSLKEHVKDYRYLRDDLESASKPEVIESAIQAARGRSIQVSQQKSEKIFNDTKTAFSEYVTEIKESPVNKEHNFFVYDKVVDQAKKNFESLKHVLGPDYHNERIMAVLAQAAISTAAYPVQKTMLDFYIKAYGDLVKQIAEQNSGQGIQQTKEQVPKLFSGDIASVQAAAKTSLEDIAKEALTNR